MDSRPLKPNSPPPARRAQGDTNQPNDTTGQRTDLPSANNAFLAPPQQPDEIGRLGPYRVLAELGRGGMGAVYRAEDPTLRRQLAVKVMAPRLAADPRAKARFIREAQAQAQVEHDHIIPIFHVGEAGGVVYIAMPLLKGQTLADALHAQPRLPLGDAVRVGREIAEGLAAAHAVGLIHRDIKPANVWLEGDRRRVKILDFGLAREATSHDGEDDQLTVAGAVMGTPAYSSPEQINGKPVDHRTDLWSLGVVLYEMATGQKPFGGPLSVLRYVVTATEPPAVHELVPGLPHAFSDLIARLLAKNPENRPVRAAEVVAELAAIEQNLTLPPQPIPFDLEPGEPHPATETGTIRSGGVSRQAGPSPPSRTRRSGVPVWMWPAVALFAAGLISWAALRTPAPVEKADKPTTPQQSGEETVPPPAVVPKTGLRFGPDSRVTFPEFTTNLTTTPTLTLEGYVTVAADQKNDSKLRACFGFWNLIGVGWTDGQWFAHVYHNKGVVPWQTTTVLSGGTLGKRTHVAAVLESNKVRLFVDGKPGGTARFNPSKHLFEQQHHLIFGQSFSGVIEEVRVSRSARDNDASRPAERFEPDSDTMALYHLDEGAGTEARDASGNKRHGPINGATWVAPKKP